MTLVLTVENETSLPNGAPTTIRVADGRSLDIGRGAHLDWTLPDPSRFISGKHCEIRYRDGGFWLYDVSTNGTFLNDSARRLQAPHRLSDGDRLTIGSYVIGVAMEPEASAHEAELGGVPAAAAAAPAAPDVLAPPPAAPVVEEAAPVPPDEHPAPVAVAAPSEANPAAKAPRLWDGERDAVPLPPPDPAPAPEVSPPAANAAAPMPPVAAFEAPTPVIADVEAPLPGPAPAPTPTPEKPEMPAALQSAEAAPATSEAPRQPGSAEEFLAHFAKGAGIPESIFARQNGLKVAEDMGALMRLIVENVTQLLAARFKAKRFARTSSQTMIQALDNNPLKFAPTPEDALRIMFGPRTSGYLDARRALDAAFKDLKAHQLKTFSAMQGAVNMLVEDLDPAEIDSALGSDKSMLDLLGARKARLWDLYMARWQAKTLRHEDGLTDAFMLYFAECYDRTDDTA